MSSTGTPLRPESLAGMKALHKFRADANNLDGSLPYALSLDVGFEQPVLASE